MPADPNDPTTPASQGAPAGNDTPTAPAGDGEADALRARVESLERELAEARERADRYHANWQRSAADFQNWKRRTDQEKQEAGRLAEGAMTLELLRVLDDVERAFLALPPELRGFTWIEGVYLIGQKLAAVLQARGLSPVDALGQEFDPHVHEAVLREEGSDGAETLVVVQELQRGYRFHERVIRPALVKVGLPKTDASGVAAGAAPDETTGGDASPVAS